MLTILSANRMFYTKLGEVGVELKVSFLGLLKLVRY
jgi:hypothetical protein